MKESLKNEEQWAEELLKQINRNRMDPLKLFEDELIWGISITHIDGNGVEKRVEPWSKEWWKIREQLNK